MAGIKFLSLFPILDSSAETLVTINVASLHFFNGINYFSHIFIINTKRYVAFATFSKELPLFMVERPAKTGASFN